MIDYIIRLLCSFGRVIKQSQIIAKRNRTIIHELSSFLMNGKYKTSAHGDCIYNSYYTQKMASQTFSSLKKINIFAKPFIKIIYQLSTTKINTKEKIFGGTEIIISSSLSEYKIFDYLRKEVLTKYKSSSKLQRVIKGKNIFAQSYNVPKTITVNNNEAYIIEELIPHVEFDSEMAFKNICISICAHTKLYISSLCTNKASYQDACVHFSNRFGESDILYEGLGSTELLSHGDLWSSNVIYDGSKQYITDFERIGSRYFLFDFFFFIFSEWHLNQKAKLIINYNEGLYDVFLHEIFQIVGHKFDTKKKDCYLAAFLVSVTYERWKNYIDINPFIESFIKKYIPSYYKNA